MTSCPARPSARAAARPMTPAPMTTASTSSTRPSCLSAPSDRRDLDARVVEAGAFGDIGPHIGRHESRDRLAGAARREPRAPFARDDPPRPGGRQLPEQGDLAPLVPHLYPAAPNGPAARP